MSWDRKRPDGPTYYYRSRRVGGRSVKEYVGTGPAAREAARRDAEDRERRVEARRAFLAETAVLEAAFARLDALRGAARTLTHAALVSAGYHRRRGQWRHTTIGRPPVNTTVAPPSERPAVKAKARPEAETKPARKSAATPKPKSKSAKGSPRIDPGRLTPRSSARPPLPEPAPQTTSPAAARTMTRQEALAEVTARANAGSPTARQGLRRLLDECPEVWRAAGDLSRLAEESWLELIAGGNVLVAESVRRHQKALKEELAGGNAPPLERLLAEQVAVTRLAALHCEAAAATPDTANAALAELRMRAVESAQRRHLNAVKTLALVRGLSRAQKT